MAVTVRSLSFSLYLSLGVKLDKVEKVCRSSFSSACVCLPACLFSFCLSICDLPSVFLFFSFVIGVINGGRGGLAWRPVFQWPV